MSVAQVEATAEPRALLAEAARELGEAAALIAPAALEAAAAEILNARRLALYGVGREGLMMRALGMRLYHLGLDAHIVGEMTTPPLSAGDLLLVSAGPGHFSTVDALVDVARDAGARTACVTAQPGGPVPSSADLILHLPAQTMADDGAGNTTGATGAGSVLPMGSLYEGVQYIAFEVLVLMLRERLARDPAAMRSRHTNLE